MSEHIDALKEHLTRKGLTDMETKAHLNWVERENAELRKLRERDALLGATAMQADQELITQLHKSLNVNCKVRDYLYEQVGKLQDLNEQLINTMNEFSDNDILREMTTSFSIFDDLSDKQRQQICHEHGQPSE